MNCFQPQSIQSMGELMDLAAVPFMFVTPRNGGTIIEVIQDTLVGSFRLTKDWTRMSDRTLANLQMVNSYFRGELPKLGRDKMFTGRQAFSQILPPSFFMEGKNKAQESVKVDDSKLVSGSMDKWILHDMSRGIIPILFHDYGPYEARQFADNIQQTVCRWLMTSGFSVGISDLVTDKETSEKLRETIRNMKQKAYEKVEEARAGLMENNSIFNNEEFFEREMTNILNKTIDMVGSISLDQINDRTNRMINMVKSGAKGKPINVSQMIGCLGQQNVDGKRVAYGFTDRTLPHYSKFDDGPDARGFVKNSFISGLTPQELFFAAMGGREGLIDTAVKTSDTGYLQRKLVKAMEDAKIYYDQTVRNANGVILQFVYGEDGMDGAHIEIQSLPYIGMGLLKMEQKYLIRPEDADMDIHLAPSNKMKMDDLERCRAHFEQLVEDRAFFVDKVFRGANSNRIMYPIPFERIIRNAIKRAGSVGLAGMPTDLSPAHVLDAIEGLIGRMVVSRRDPGQGIRFFHCLVRLYLSPKPLIMEHHMPKSVFDQVVVEIERTFRRAVVQPGEMVGVVAAQTIGENSTQLVLDSFHSSGTVAAVKATSGVPRFKELLSVSKHIKTPILKIHLKEDIGTLYDPVEDEEGNIIDARIKEEAKGRVMRVMSSLEITRLCDILESTEIYWDPPGADGLDTNVPGDDGMLEVYRNFSMMQGERTTSPWVLRMKISREKIHRIGLTMLDIHLRLVAAYSDVIECMFSDDNAEELVFRVRLTKKALTDVDTSDGIAAVRAMEHNLVHNVLLKGMRGIRKVSMAMSTQTVYSPGEDRFRKRAEWVIDTDGTNLQEILANPNVDAARTRSNDIWEIYHALGIEAARNALRAEILDVVGEDSMSYRHLSLLLDTICNRGTLMSIDRHGINRGDTSVLSRASFEEPVDLLLKAGFFSEHDVISGVSANIMLGQLPTCGTGDSEVLLDEHRYIQLLQERYGTRRPALAEAQVEEIADMSVGPGDTDACGYQAIAFTFDMPKANTCAREMPKPSFTLA